MVPQYMFSGLALAALSLAQTGDISQDYLASSVRILNTSTSEVASSLDTLTKLTQRQKAFIIDAVQNPPAPNATGFSPSQMSMGPTTSADVVPALFLNSTIITPPAPNDTLSVTRSTTAIGWTDAGYNRLINENMTVSLYHFFFDDRAFRNHQGNDDTVDCNALLGKSCILDLFRISAPSPSYFELPASCRPNVVTIGGPANRDPEIALESRIAGSHDGQVYPHAYVFPDTISYPVEKGNTSYFEFTQSFIKAFLVVQAVRGMEGPGNHSTYLFCGRPANVVDGAPVVSKEFVDRTYESGGGNVMGRFGVCVGVAAFVGLFLSL